MAISTQQVFNCDETGLFWKKMPRRTYITEEEKALPGHKPMKDRLTLLLCGNASGDFKISDWLRAGRSGDRIPVGGEIFRSCPDRPWGAPSLLYNGHRVMSGGKERPGSDPDPLHPSSAVVKKE